MNKKSLLAGILALFSVTLFAQESIKLSKGRPNIPGTFLMEFGFNRALNAPDTFNITFLGSRSLNLYYQHEIKIPILKGKFSFHPGIGLGMERFKLKDNNTLAYDAEGNLQLQAIDGISLNKSQLITNYLDAPIELRFSTNPYDPGRSFKMAVGFRAGVLLKAHTKIKYEEEGDKIKIKDSQPWNVNNFRYGLYGRIGVGNFTFFGYSNMTSYFKKGEGLQGKDMNTLTIGVSLAGF
jgi:hypothetical protein